MGHALCYCVGVCFVVPDLPGVNDCLVSVLPVVMGVEISRYVQVWTRLDWLYDFCPFARKAGGVNVEYVDVLVVDDSDYFAGISVGDHFLWVELELLSYVCRAFGVVFS